MTASRWIFLLLLCFSIPTLAQPKEPSTSSRWQIAEDGGIVWNLRQDALLPHNDHMAMSGQSVDMILEWNIDAEGVFHANRVVRWPMLRTTPDNTHASLQQKLGDDVVPRPSVNGKALSSGYTQSVRIHGALTVTSRHDEGIDITRTIFTTVQSPAVIDLFRLTNWSGKRIEIVIPGWSSHTPTEARHERFGSYIIDQNLIGEGAYLLAPGESIEYAVVRSARRTDDPPYVGNPSAELAARRRFIADCEENLVLETPDPVLNRLFAFSKIRAAESIFSTRGGLMHGPGGYNKYLAAIWANDQAEYVNPFFPFLGNDAGNESAMNSLRHFARYMNPEYKPIPSSIIAEGRGYWNGAGDRGDMAMIAYGASRFALASANPEWSRELWPLIEWCLEYCNRKKTPDGVIASETDELEGRFPAGDANLCTSSLYYDALISSACLASELEMDRQKIEEYRRQADEVRRAIKNYFEADVEGYATYRYYDGNTVLRSWICIPLTVGIGDRAEGTIDALFSPRLWTENGLVTEAGSKTVWDRSTLYALRGVMASGRVEKGLEKLRDFSKTRLLGDHVPYVIEAFPEFNQSHLSAESGLYCRIFTEGMFGIRPTGWQTFECTPSLPNDWQAMALHRIHAFGLTWNMEVSRDGSNVQVRITDGSDSVLYEKSFPAGKSHSVYLGRFH